MKINRRSFVAALAAIPFVGKLVVSRPLVPERLVFEKEVEVFNFVYFAQVLNSVNDRQWYGRPALHWRLTHISWNRMENGNLLVRHEFFGKDVPNQYMCRTPEQHYTLVTLNITPSAEVDFDQFDFGKRVV